MPEDLQLQPENNPTPIIVAIPGVGNVHFPDDMPMEQIHVAAKNIHQKVNRIYSPDPVQPMLDTEDAGGPYPRSKPLPEMNVGHLKQGAKQLFGVKTPTQEDYDAYPELEQEAYPGMPHQDDQPIGPSESAPTIPRAGLSTDMGDRSSLSDPKSDDWRNAMAERGQMREGWDSNPETQKKEEEILDDPIYRRESDAKLARVKTQLTSVTALNTALDSYDKAGPTTKKKLEKQIFQKIIDYRRDAKAMDGSTKTEIDKRLAKYSNSLVKKK